MTGHVGIVACSAEGAALCFRTICAEAGGYEHPEISMHAHPLADYMQCIERDDWAGVGELMLASAEKLAKSGADFLICPDNTIHQALPYIEARSPLPWLPIARVVANEAEARGYQRIGLTGTKYLVGSDVYPASYVRPNAADREEMNRIIFGELVPGVFRPEATAWFQQLIVGFKEQGCDAVVLGCTEIPLIITDANSPLPVLDSTRLLARAALHTASTIGTHPPR